MSRRAVLIAWSLTSVGLLPVTARAEIVHFATGRTLAVRSHRIEGTEATLVLRAGGEIVCPASLISKVELEEAIPAASTASVPEVVAARPPGARGTPPGPYAAMITSAAQRHDVDPVLVHAVIRAESNFHPRARSRRGARGLMQLMPATLRQYAVGNPYDPAANIDAGTRHLRGLLDRFTLEEALAVYNAGQDAVLRHGGVPPFRETRAYVAQILREVSGPSVAGPPASNP